MKGIFKVIESGVPYAPPTVILGVSLLHLTTFERQFLMLILLIWVNVFFLLRAWLAQ